MGDKPAKSGTRRERRRVASVVLHGASTPRVHTMQTGCTHASRVLVSVHDTIAWSHVPAQVIVAPARPRCETARPERSVP